MKRFIIAISVATGLISSASVKADTFGSGANQFSIDFSTIGNPGNAADTTGYGSVGYTYRIGTYEVSQENIDKAVSSGLANVSSGAWNANQPAANISWYEAAAFVNWLNTSQGYEQAYNLSYSGVRYSMAIWSASDAWNLSGLNLYRNAACHYFLPSVDEWYKAAYGLNDGSGYTIYPIGSNNTPTATAGGTTPGTTVYGGQNSPADITNAGGLSSYGTMAQGGNIWEMLETADGSPNNSDVNANRDVRGGDYGDTDQPEWELSTSAPSMSADTKQSNIGFRIASVPEPSTYALFGLGTFGLLLIIRRKKTA